MCCAICSRQEKRPQKQDVLNCKSLSNNISVNQASKI